MSDDDNHERINRNCMLKNLIVFTFSVLVMMWIWIASVEMKIPCVKELNHGPRIEFPNVTVWLS